MGFIEHLARGRIISLPSLAKYMVTQKTFPQHWTWSAGVYISVLSLLVAKQEVTAFLATAGDGAILYYDITLTIV